MTASGMQALRVRQGGFTLLETLGIVALMAIVAAVAARNLGGTADSARRRAAVSAVRDIDARARILSASGKLELVVDRDRRALVLRRGTDTLIRQDLPARCEAHLFAGGRPTTSIVYARTGTSQDFTVYLVLPDAQAAIDIAGLTGWLEAPREGPP